MTTAQDQQSRAEFERERVRQVKPDGPIADALERNADGNYVDRCTAYTWEIWQAARALPAGMEPVARVCQGATANIEWRKGMTYADLPAIDRQDLYTAAQVLAMGRVPPEWQAVPVEPTTEIVDAAAESHMPFGDMALAIQSAIAAAPRPPAAQEATYTGASYHEPYATGATNKECK